MREKRRVEAQACQMSLYFGLSSRGLTLMLIAQPNITMRLDGRAFRHLLAARCPQCSPSESELVRAIDSRNLRRRALDVCYNPHSRSLKTISCRNSRRAALISSFTSIERVSLHSPLCVRLKRGCERMPQALVFDDGHGLACYVPCLVCTV